MTSAITRPVIRHRSHYRVLLDQEMAGGASFLITKDAARGPYWFSPQVAVR